MAVELVSPVSTTLATSRLQTTVYGVQRGPRKHSKSRLVISQRSAQRKPTRHNGRWPTTRRGPWEGSAPRIAQAGQDECHGSSAMTEKEMSRVNPRLSVWDLGFCLWIPGSPLSSGILAVNGFRVLSLPVPIILPLFVLGAFPPLPFPRPGVLVGLHSGGGLPLFTGMAVLDSWC